MHLLPLPAPIFTVSHRFSTPTEVIMLVTRQDCKRPSTSGEYFGSSDAISRASTLFTTVAYPA
jgi:hypothetical protein